MYSAVAATIVGQALALGQPILLLYATAFTVAVAAFVHWYDEPTPAPSVRRAVRGVPARVPAWWPRRKPWKADNVERSDAR